MTEQERNELHAVFKAKYDEDHKIFRPPQVKQPRPAELDSPTTSPELRAQVLAAYTGHLTDLPAHMLTAEDRKLVQEQVMTVLRGMDR